MKIYTQNCFGVPIPGTFGRMKRIAAKISEISPDVVFLQEIQWKSLVKIFQIPGFELFFENGLYATAGGLLTLVKTELVCSGKFSKFSSQGGIRQIADKMLGKGFLDVYVPKENLHLINTHFLATYSPGFLKDKDQLLQMEQLMKYVKPFKKVLVGGDLNFSEGSQYYEKLISELTDFSAGMGISHPILKMKIDFVLGKGVKLAQKKEFVEFPGFVSDHKGILVKVEI